MQTAQKPIFNMSDFELPNHGPVRLIEFEIPGGVTTPRAFAQAVAEQPADFFAPPARAVILSGRGPVWGYAMMAHAAHPTPWVATVDPRLGAVVVQTHLVDMHVGQIVEPTPEERIDG